MSVFGAGASTYAAECEEFATSRLTEVTVTTVPAGTAPALRSPHAGSQIVLSSAFHSPLEAGAVGPNTVKDDGDLAGNGDLGLLGTDPLHQPDAPSLQR